MRGSLAAHGDRNFLMTQSLAWPDLLTALVQGQDMDEQATKWAMTQILSGDVPAATMAAFMVALRAKGETVDEVAGLSEAMLDKAATVQLDTDAVDIVGSGGDRANTVNISTMAAVVAAAAGARVVKHGNRAASSQCVTADVLEQLGLQLRVTPEAQAEVLRRAGIVFLFAPMYHASLKYTAPIRRELAIQTTFNFLGPLSNPARPQAAAIGIANLRMAELVAGVLAKRGGRGMVFHGDDGLDELTTTTTSDLWLYRDGQLQRTELDPRSLGISAARPADLVGGDPSENAGIFRELLAGKPGPVRDIVTLNAAAALLAFDGPQLAVAVTEQFQPYLERVNTAIDDGSAAEVLDRWIEATQTAALAD